MTSTSNSPLPDATVNIPTTQANIRSAEMQTIPPEIFYGPKKPAQPDVPHTPPPTKPTNLPEEVKESPIRHSASGYNVFTSMHYLKSPRHRQMEAECRGKFVGPMPPANFLKEFLPDEMMKPGAPSSKDFQMSASSRGHFKKAAECRKEVRMYPHLINGIKEYCPDMNVVDTHKDEQESSWARSGTKIKPDISSYARNATTSRKLDLEKAEVITEVKLSPLDDPFIDCPPQTSAKRRRGPQNRSVHENPSTAGSDARGQITTYAQAQLAAQYRTHVFSVIIVKGGARLVRWDRAGAVFTSKFDYIKYPYLAEFFWRYNYALPAARGLDTTVEKITPSPVFDEVLSKARIGLSCGDADLYRFEVVDEETKEKTYYIGARPSFVGNKSLTGRATRGILVYDIKNDRMAYLKDTWRVYGSGYAVEMEGKTYKKLHEAGVKHIPTIVTYGDIGDERWHCTQTQRYALRTNNPLGRLRGHRHSRLVMKEVGRDLSSFRNTGEIVSAMADALEAHTDAYEKAGILHRDVSAGNILIMRGGRGLLIDWDLSKELDQMGIPRQAERTGTWQFMSARLLMSPTAQSHELADDLESFYHVLVWVTLRFTKLGSNDSNRLTKFFHRNFDETWSVAKTGKTDGGESKSSYLLQRQVRKFKVADKRLKSLIDELATTLRVRYEEPPSPDERREYEKGLAAEEELEAMAPTSEMKQKMREVFQQRQKKDPVLQYNTRIELLRTSEWMCKQFRKTAEFRHRMTGTKKVNRIDDDGVNEEVVRKTPSEMQDDSRPRQHRDFGHKSPYDDQIARFAPGAPTIVDGKAVFPPESEVEETQQLPAQSAPLPFDLVEDEEMADAEYVPWDDVPLEDKGYDSAWDKGLDDEELDKLIAEQEGSGEDVHLRSPKADEEENEGEEENEEGEDDDASSGSDMDDGDDEGTFGMEDNDDE